MMPDDKPRISIIVPVHNGGERFRRCLLSLKGCQPQPEEIIVVADGDTDGSWQVAEEFGARVLRTPICGGPARARNLGAREARGEVLFFVDADVTVPRDAVSQITAAFQCGPDFVAVFGSYDDKPGETNFLSQYKNLFHHYVHQTAKEDASTFWGACGAIRREVFLTIGGFDEGYRRPSIEDIELGYRLKKAGHKIRLLKGLQVKHLKHWGVWSLLRADFSYRALPWTRLILSEGRFLDDLNLKLSNRISVVLVYASIVCGLGGVFMTWLYVPAIVMMATLLLVNWDLYRFFRDKRGLVFAIRTIAWHWFYYCYSGLAFSLGFAGYRMKRTRTRG